MFSRCARALRDPATERPRGKIRSLALSHGVLRDRKASGSAAGSYGGEGHPFSVDADATARYQAGASRSPRMTASPRSVSRVHSTTALTSTRIVPFSTAAPPNLVAIPVGLPLTSRVATPVCIVKDSRSGRGTDSRDRGEPPTGHLPPGPATGSGGSPRRNSGSPMSGRTRGGRHRHRERAVRSCSSPRGTPVPPRPP